jgi:4'-phosphopantetheinyl transferase
MKVEIVRASLSADPAPFEASLSAEERARADRFAFPRERARFVVSRGLLRAVLARRAGGTPAGQSIVIDPLGKPRLGGTCGQGRLRFNVSHTGDLWACALTVGAEVGLDVEEVRPDRSIESIARTYFKRAEADAVLGLEGAGRVAAFHRVWTRKEAWLKARGFGITVALDSFEVSHGAGDARLVATRPEPDEAARWTLRDLDLGPGFAGAVAVEGTAAEVLLG